MEDQIHAYEQHFKETVAHHRRNIEKYESQMKQYNELVETLTTLPHKLSHEIMVPLGSQGMGFIPGKIVHTNEVIILAGAKYFFKTSAHHAVQMIQRRITKTKENINAERDEMQKLFHRVGLTQQLEALQREYDEEGITEIREEYDEEAEKITTKVSQQKVQVRTSELLHDDEGLNNLFDQLLEEEREEDERERNSKVLSIDADLENEFAQYFSGAQSKSETTKSIKSVHFAPPPTTTTTTTKDHEQKPVKIITGTPKSVSFTGTVVERQESIQSVQQESTQPEQKKVSKFKQQMMQKR